MSVPAPSAEGAWVGVWGGEKIFRYTHEAWSSLGSSEAALPIDFGSEMSEPGNELLALRRDLSLGAAIFDRTTGKTATIEDPAVAGADLPQPLEDAAMVTVYPSYNRPEGWVWTRARGKFEPLVNRKPSDVADLKSDGATLVWLETPERNPPDTGEWGPATLYTSPYTTLAAEVVPTARRSNIPTTGPGPTSAAGDGYYAVYSFDADIITIVRLTDGYAWSLTPMEPMAVFTVAYIDSDYLFYWTQRNVYRIRLDSLGPPSPP